MMKRTYYYISVCCLLAAFTSCNDWLDVQPRSQVEDKDLFSSEAGFKEALSGVYSAMVSEKTYTKEMVYGAIGVLGQEWENYPAASTVAYPDMVEYIYDTTLPANVISNIWANSYNAIANANHIINNIDEKQHLFSRDNYRIIKGEALALRAFLHFDLLRCFGVCFAQDPSMPSIPYCTDLTHRVFPQLTVSEVATLIELDLLAAEELLKVDPVYTGEKITEMVDNGYLINRRVHLNYYAVKALEARLYMWIHQYGKATKCAQEVITSDMCTWASSSDMEKGYDYSCVTEHLFALNVLTLSTLVEKYFNEESNSSSFSLKFQTLLNFYDENTDDYRYLYQFRKGTTSQFIDYRYLAKFDESKISSASNLASREEGAAFYSNKIPLIRLSEMYLIRSECQYRESGSGLSALNELRVARNSKALENEPGDYYMELIREYRREFIGEGQLFFLYKRLNSASVIRSDADMIGEKAYTFPIPITETDAAQRKNNR